MYEHVRVMFHAIEPAPGEDVADQQVQIDLVLNGDGRVHRDLPYFGVFGAIERETASPFILRRDGKIDYGYHSDASAGGETTNLRDREIKVGEYVSWSDGVEEWTLRVVRILTAGNY